MAIYVYSRAEITPDQRVAVEKLNATQIFEDPDSVDFSTRNSILARLCCGDTMVATTLSEFATSVRELTEITTTLYDSGVTLRVLDINLDTSTGHGQRWVSTLKQINDFQRLARSIRIKHGLVEADSKGLRSARFVVSDEIKATTIKLATEAHMSATQIAGKLGIGVATVYRILASHRAAGETSGIPSITTTPETEKS